MLNDYRASRTTEPEVGMPVSVTHGSDRTVAEIAEVIRFKSGARKGEIKAVTLRPVKAKIVSGGEHDGSARYEYERMPDAPAGRKLYTRRKNGVFSDMPEAWASKLILGMWDYYRDPHI